MRYFSWLRHHRSVNDIHADEHPFFSWYLLMSIKNEASGRQEHGLIHWKW